MRLLDAEEKCRGRGMVNSHPACAGKIRTDSFVSAVPLSRACQHVSARPPEHPLQGEKAGDSMSTTVFNRPGS